MADYLTHFSCVLDVGTYGNAVRTLEIYNNQPEDEDGFHLSDGFLLSLETEGGTQLWIYDDGAGDPECVIKFVLLCAKTFEIKGLWGFEYANTCSKPRLDGFGGGAYVVDLEGRKSIAWMNTNDWLATALSRDDLHA